MSHRGYQIPANPNVPQQPSTLVQHNSWKTSHPISRSSSQTSKQNPQDSALATTGVSKPANGTLRSPHFEEEHEYASNSDDMEDRRPPLHRPTDGRSQQPLLHNEDDDDAEERGRTGYSTSQHRQDRPTFSRRSTMRSRSPDTQAKLDTNKKYTYAAFFLGLSLISFTVQTETAVYIQHTLKWEKAYCMLWVGVVLLSFSFANICKIFHSRILVVAMAISTPHSPNTKVEYTLAYILAKTCLSHSIDGTNG